MSRLLTWVILLTLQIHFVAPANVARANNGTEDILAVVKLRSGNTESRGKLAIRSPNATSRSLTNTNNLVALKKIRGTKLYTGIYYRVGVKAFPQGWVTWANKGNYIQIELNPGELPKYTPGKEFQFDNQWTFGATESDVGYTMTNRGKPYGFLIWVNAEVGSGHHVAVYDDPTSRAKMSAGGEWRNDALWIPKETNEENYYKLENVAKRSSFLTWTWTKHNDFNYYIQLAHDAAEDSKFSFEPSAIKLHAKVFDFKFNETLEDILEGRGNQDTSLVAKKRFPNYSGAVITSTLEESIQMKDQVTIGFKESLSMMYKTSVSLNLLVASGGTELEFQGGFEANQEKSTEVTKTVTLKTEIQIPPFTDIEASIYTVWANNVEMPFTAKMQVTGLAERIVVNRPDEVREGYVPADVVEDFILSSGGGNMKIISRIGDTFIVSVCGTIKGNFGLKSVVSTAEVGELNIK